MTGGGYVVLISVRHFFFGQYNALIAPLPPLQPVERPPERTMEGGGKGDGLESGQMPARADV